MREEFSFVVYVFRGSKRRSLGAAVGGFLESKSKNDQDSKSGTWFL